MYFKTIKSVLNVYHLYLKLWGWSGGAVVLGKLSVPGRPKIWIIVGQGPIALAVGAGRGCLDIFTILYLFSSLSPSLWETARYRLKHCLKGPLNPKQPSNQPTLNYMNRKSNMLRDIHKEKLSKKYSSNDRLKWFLQM